MGPFWFFLRWIKSDPPSQHPRKHFLPIKTECMKITQKVSLLLLLLHNVPCVKRFLFNKSADVFILCRHLMTPDSDVIIRLHSIMTSESGVIICLHSIKTPEFRLHYTWFRRHYTSKFGIFDKFLQFTVESFLTQWSNLQIWGKIRCIKSKK